MIKLQLHRIVAAALAAGTTLVLFSAVVSIAPQQEMAELMARASTPSAPVLAQRQAPELIAQGRAYNVE